MALDLPQITAFLSHLQLFAGLDDDLLAFVATRMVQVPLDELVLVYEQGQEARSLFFIYEGRVQATRYLRGSTEEQMVGFLDQNDMFGHEVLEARELRQLTIQTVTDVTLLRLDAQAIGDISTQIPDLLPRLDLALKSFHLMLTTPLNWVNPEEYVFYISRKHPIFLWSRLGPTIVLSVLVIGLLVAAYGLWGLSIFLIFMGGTLLLAGVLLLWFYVDWSNDYYIITSQRVVSQERIVFLYDSRQESPMDQVQSTEVDRSYFGRLLHYGDVFIRSFTGLITFQGVPLPNEVDAIIQEHKHRSQSSLRQADIRAIEGIIAQRIGMLPARPAAPSNGTEKAAQPSQIQHFLSDLFRQRYEVGDTIQYRTHWWILITRIWFQSFLLLANFIAILFMLFESARGQLGPDFPLVGAFFGLSLIGLGISLWWLYIFLDWHNDIYLIDNEQVVDISRKPLGEEERRAALIRNILSVEYQRIGVIGLLLNFGTVFIRIGEAEFTFDNVFNPSEVQRELFNRIALRTIREREQQADIERQRMAEWIAAYHRLTRN